MSCNKTGRKTAHFLLLAFLIADRRLRCAPCNPGAGLAAEFALPVLRRLLVEKFLKPCKHPAYLFGHTEVQNGV